MSEIDEVKKEAQNGGINDFLNTSNQPSKVINNEELNRLLGEPLTLESTVDLLKLCTKFPEDTGLISMVQDKTRGSEFLDKAVDIVEFDKKASSYVVDSETLERVAGDVELQKSLEQIRESDSPTIDENMAAYVQLIDGKHDETFLIDRPEFKPIDIMDLDIDKARMLDINDMMAKKESERVFGPKVEQKESPKPTIQVEDIVVDGEENNRDNNRNSDIKIPNRNSNNNYRDSDEYSR